jgi:hypothetical protein
MGKASPAYLMSIDTPQSMHLINRFEEEIYNFVCLTLTPAETTTLVERV